MRKKGLIETLERRFADQLKKMAWFHAGLRIGVGVSGGADSVALLSLLMELRRELGVVVSAVHFNHKLRGKASDADEKFVVALAERLGLKLHVGRADVAQEAKREKANLEEVARRSRYGFFERLTEQGTFDIITTAHTMDDQAETVLAHILRGTGIAGLAGIHPLTGKVARPLLGFRREELRKYLRAKKQSWREDKTNRDTTRTRARMRKKLLPLLAKEFSPAAVEHLAALAERALEQTSFVEHFAEQVFLKHVLAERNGARIGIAELLNPFGLTELRAGHVLPAKVLQKIIDGVRQRRGQISAEHVEMILALAKNGESGKRLQIPGGVDVLRDRDALVFRPRTD